MLRWKMGKLETTGSKEGRDRAGDRGGGFVQRCAKGGGNRGKPNEVHRLGTQNIQDDGTTCRIQERKKTHGEQ